MGDIVRHEASRIKWHRYQPKKSMSRERCTKGLGEYDGKTFLTDVIEVSHDLRLVIVYEETSKFLFIDRVHDSKHKTREDYMPDHKSWKTAWDEFSPTKAQLKKSKDGAS